VKSDFHDPPAPDQSTLFQWAGGFPALLRLTRRFYEVHVPEDPLLQGCSRRCPPTIPSASPPGSAQVFGGPPAYSERYGEYDRMISQQLDKALTPERRARWVLLLARSADDVGLPADAEFRAAFTAYLEWGSRIALENSQPGVHPPPHMPVPAGGGYATLTHGPDHTPPPTPSRTSRRTSPRPPISRSPTVSTSSRYSASATATRCASPSTSGPTKTSAPTPTRSSHAFKRGRCHAMAPGHQNASKPSNVGQPREARRSQANPTAISSRNAQAGPRGRSRRPR
jgi:truncated hemoglobin YjbI